MTTNRKKFSITAGIKISRSTPTRRASFGSSFPADRAAFRGKTKKKTKVQLKNRTGRDNLKNNGTMFPFQPSFSVLLCDSCPTWGPESDKYASKNYFPLNPPEFWNVFNNFLNIPESFRNLSRNFLHIPENFRKFPETFK